MRDLVVFEQIAFRVGHDEFILAFAVADRIRGLAFVFDQADDLEFDLPPVRRLDEERLAQLERSSVAAWSFRRAVAARFDRGPPVPQRR